MVTTNFAKVELLGVVKTWVSLLKLDIFFGSPTTPSWFVIHSKACLCSLWDVLLATMDDVVFIWIHILRNVHEVLL
jgi:hypothetical protein